LFKAKSKNGKLSGQFYSGNHWQEPWEAVRNDNFYLRNPDSLTWVKEGIPVAFNFPDLKGERVSLNDAKFKNKIKIIQVMGTWCPNCLDESRFLSEIIEEFPSQIEVVALAFEKGKDAEKWKERINDFQSEIGTHANYTYLLAGRASKKEASEALPFLNHVMSFPTMVVLNQNDEVVYVHTGFNGPGTGSVYNEFTKGFRQLINDVIMPKI
jgi:thiol-disulfide isomerase/thioredoxin